MVSSLWLLGVCLGSYLGTTLGSALFDTYSFEESTYIECMFMALAVSHFCLLPTILKCTYVCLFYNFLSGNKSKLYIHTVLCMKHMSYISYGNKADVTIIFRVVS